MIKKSFIFLGVISTFIALPSLVHAATEEQSRPGIIDRLLPKFSFPEKFFLNKAPEKVIKGADEPKIDKSKSTEKTISALSSVNFTGFTVVGNDILQDTVKPYIGKELSEADLAQLKYEVTRVFYDRGYILVKVATPPQNLKNSILNVEIYEAKVGKVHIHDNGVLKPRIVETFVDQINENKIFEETDVESMVSDINSLKGVKASVTLQPGKEFLVTDVHLNVEEADEDSNSVQIDNYGSELTGTNVATLSLEKSNYFGYGESFSFRGRRSNEDLWSTEFGVAAPIGYRNLIVDATFLHSENEIGDRLAALDADGETNVASVGISSKLVNTRTKEISIRGGFQSRTHKSFLSDIRDTKDDIRQLVVEGSMLHRPQSNFVYYTSLTLRQGIDILGASSKGDAGNSRALGEHEAFIVQPLVFASFRPADAGEVKILLTGQVSTNTLLSSDLFVLGGYGNVRGFEPAQETGEGGYQFSLEYNHEFAVMSDWVLKAGPWIDGGTVYNRLDGAVEDKNLYSAGLGFEATTELVPNMGDTTLRLDWAHPIGDYTSSEVDSNTVYFRVTQPF